MTPITPRDHIRAIIAETAASYEVGVDDIMSESRRAAHVAARNAAIRKVRVAYPHMTRARLGEMFGRDRSVISRVIGRKFKRGPSRAIAQEAAE